MTLTAAWETICLFLLGLGGWALFSRLRLPVAPLLGTLTLLTALRALGLAIPPSPYWLFPVVQVLLGLRVGFMVTRETVRGFKLMIAPAVIIILWTQSVIFLMGPLLARMTTLDLHTALLSSSMGGLPEMIILSLDTEADPGFVIMMQTLRMVVSVSLFPFIVKKWAGEQNSSIETSGKLTNHAPSFAAGGNSSRGKNYIDSFKERVHSYMLSFTKLLTSEKGNHHGNPFRNKLNNFFYKIFRPIGRRMLIFFIASGGGSIFHHLGVPAGFMIGAIFTVALTSLTGVKAVSIPSRMFSLILVGVGISVADNILPESFTELTDLHLLILVAIATVFIFMSSFLVALLVHHVSGRDLPISILAAAPGGLFVMITLAVEYDKDPFFVSMLHLSRLLSIQMVVPFVFMYFM